MNIAITSTGPPTVAGRLADALSRHAYAALALPVGLGGLLAVPLGRARSIGRLQQSLARRFLRVDVGAGAERKGATRRVLTHAVVSLPVNLVAFTLVVPMWATFVTRGVLYPVFAGDHLDQSWGGPTLPGAWFVHFIQGPPLLLLVTLVLRPLSRFQARQAERYFGVG